MWTLFFASNSSSSKGFRGLTSAFDPLRDPVFTSRCVAQVLQADPPLQLSSGLVASAVQGTAGWRLQARYELHLCAQRAGSQGDAPRRAVELRFDASRPNFSKTRLCKNFQLGHCELGEACTFAHGSEELIQATAFVPKHLSRPLKKHKETLESPLKA